MAASLIGYGKANGIWSSSPAAPVEGCPGPVRRTESPRFGLSTAAVTAPLSNLKLVATAKTLVATQNITETFLWSFLGLDVLGMWVPRINVSLKRGAIPYNSDQDPSMKDKPLGTQVRHSMWQNFKGLNWINFYEEAMREVMTGPGMLVVPTLIYYAAKNQWGYGYAGNALRLQQSALTDHSHRFMDRLEGLSSAHPLNNASESTSFLSNYRTQVKDHLVEALIENNEHFASHEIDLGQVQEAFEKTLKPEERGQLPDALKPGKASSQTMTGKEYLSRWFDHWTHQQIQNGVADKATQKSVAQAAALAEKHLKFVLIDQYAQNSKLAHELTQLKAGELADSKLSTMKSDSLKVMGEHKSFGQFMSELPHLRDYFNTVAKEGMAKERLSGVQGKLSAIAKNVYGQVSHRKGIFTVASTLLTAIYVAILVRLTQNHKEYPAERLSYQHHAKHHPLQTTAHPLSALPIAKSQASPFVLPTGTQTDYALAGGQ